MLILDVPIASMQDMAPNGQGLSLVAAACGRQSPKRRVGVIA